MPSRSGPTPGRSAPRHSAPRSSPRRAWRRAPLIAAIVVLIAGIVFAGLLVVRHRQSAQASAATPAAASPAAQASPPTGSPAPPSCGDGEALLASMSERDKLAQLLMVGVTGAADATAVAVNHHVGGIFIGSWTDKSILTDGSLPKIASAGPLPLAVSVDEEGGRVDRLASLIGPAPSARALAASASTEQVYQQALARGQKMRELGITVDFAPVVDVSDQAADTVIGDRSFSADPATVTRYARAYAAGLRDAGLLPVIKHFPGHGHGSGDSHTGAVTTPPLELLQNNDLVPYRELLAEPGNVAVMVGHLQVPGLTDELPASLSKAVIDMLRTGTGYAAPPFDGPVFTDDLSTMRAISDTFGVSQAVLKALQAGADIALWVSTDEVPAVLDRLQAALAGGELNRDAVDASVLRMAKVKGRNPQCPS